MKMIGIEPVTNGTDLESFYSGALGRISQIMLVLAFVCSIVAWWRYGERVAIGFVSGCAVAYLNFHWLKRVVPALANRVPQPGRVNSSKGMLVRSFFR